MTGSPTPCRTSDLPSRRTGISPTYSKTALSPEFAARFFGALEPLQEAGRLGPALFQLPPYAKADPDRLRVLLSLCPDGRWIAFEFRNISCFTDSIYQPLGARLRKGEYTHEAPAAIAADAAKLRKREVDPYLFFMHQDDPTGPKFAEEVLRITQQ